MAHSQYSLLGKRRFLPLFLTQFLGAFNDNVFKNALLLMVTFKYAAFGLSADAVVSMVALASGIFILPFFLFSATAGQMADKFEKARLIRATKILEVIVMTTAAVGFYTSNLWVLMSLLFLMGAQSALFGPLKYGILPDHLSEDELMGGNALIETGTFLSILLGTIAGGLLVMLEPNGPVIVAGIVITVAVLGWIASCFIPPIREDQRSADLVISPNFVTETFRVMKASTVNKRVFMAIVAISWFWLVGATFLGQFPPLTKDFLGGNEQVVTLLLAAFSVGIGVGSMLCNKLSGGHPRTSFVWKGALGLTVFTLGFCASVFCLPASAGAEQSILAFLGGGLLHWLVLANLIGIAICGGIFIVPLYVVLQHDSEKSETARTIAANNVVNALFMVASAIAVMGLLAVGLNLLHIFALVGVANLWIVWLCRKHFG
ncbi:MAG: MFS transporter [Proteobacteria bacterium]|nr:MFS transporter [Pseudomonadota bacterium]